MNPSFSNWNPKRTGTERELPETALAFQWVGTEEPEETQWSPQPCSVSNCPAAQPWHGLSAYVHFPIDRPWGVGVIAHVINQGRQWWYHTAPFQQSQVVLFWHCLVQGPCHGSFHSFIFMLSCMLHLMLFGHSSWSRQGCNVLVIITWNPFSINF